MECTLKISIIWFILLLTLDGCVPIPVPYGPYYEPSYENPSARVVREGCHGASGAPSGIKFQIDQGIMVEIKTAYRSGYEGDLKHPFFLTMTIPKGAEIRFLSDEIRVSDGNTIINADFPKNMIVRASAESDAARMLEMVSLIPVSLEELKKSGQIPQMALWFWLKEESSKGFEPDHLEIVLPTIKKKTDEVNFEPIMMDAEINKRDKNYLTLEMRNERKEKYHRCLKETPNLHCENILEVYQGGFKIQKDDFNATGRVGGWNGSIGVGINDMMTTSPEPWKFIEPIIVLKDRDNGAQQKRQIGKLYLHTPHYEVPFPTPVHAPLGQLEGNAFISINGSLGEELKSNLEIQLPSLLINGKKFDFKPIKLKLKLLDGEFPPFNC